MKLLLLKGKILLSKNLHQKKRINHRLCTRVLRQGDIDLPQEVKLIGEDLLEGIQDHVESVLPQEGGGFRDLQEDTIDIPYPEAEVDRGMIVMDHDVDYHHLLDVEDLILEGGRGRPGDKGIDEKDLEIVARVAVRPEVGLDDLP